MHAAGPTDASLLPGYEPARRAFAIVTTSESRPYGCVLLTKGVI